jgi:hypothetical protein
LTSPRAIRCPAGEWTTLVSNFGAGMPRTFRVRLAAAPGGEVAGTFEEKAAAWIFPRPPRTGELRAEMEFHRRWINAIYKIRIRPTADVIAEIR